MLIDFHTHAFPDKLVPKAIPKLEAIGNIKSYGDGSVKNLLSHMSGAGVDRSVILNIATNAHQQSSVNSFAIQTGDTYPNLYTLGSLHPDSENIAEEAKRLSDAGIRGIKLHPDYINTFIDDPKLDPIYKVCVEYNLFVVSHSGWDFISPDCIHCTPERILNVLAKFPTLRFVAAHMGANRQWDEVERLLVGKNVWIDTSLAVPFGMDDEQFRRILTNHLPDHILFGSDYPWFTPEDTYRRIIGLGLPNELLEGIFYKNALALLGDGTNK